MSLLAAHGDWLQRLQARADQPPRRVRLPLWWHEVAIGSVEPGVLDALTGETGPAGGPLVLKFDVGAVAGWQLRGELTSSLAQLAFGLRRLGLAHAWRNEQLAVRAPDGRVLGTVERAVRGWCRCAGLAGNLQIEDQEVEVLQVAHRGVGNLKVRGLRREGRFRSLGRTRERRGERGDQRGCAKRT